MDAIDFDTLDATIETERTQFATALRRIADRLETRSVEDVIELVTTFRDQVCDFARRSNLVLRLLHLRIRLEVDDRHNTPNQVLIFSAISLRRSSRKSS
jgi:hypothetical protein